MCFMGGGVILINIQQVNVEKSFRQRGKLMATGKNNKPVYALPKIDI